MKIVKIIVLDDNNEEKELNVVDGSAELLCENEQLYSQVTSNNAINFNLMKKLLKD